MMKLVLEMRQSLPMNPKCKDLAVGFSFVFFFVLFCSLKRKILYVLHMQIAHVKKVTRDTRNGTNQHLQLVKVKFT